MDDNVPLNKFLGHVENERAIFLKTQVVVNSVHSPTMNSIRKSLSTVGGPTEMSSPTPSEDSLVELTARGGKLQQELSRSYRPRPTSGTQCSCAYC